MELMRQLITEFPNQMRDAWSVIQKSRIELKGFSPNGVLILGMGGSGISGVIASRMLAATSPVPILANSDYSIPGWVGPKTLIIACSYSGNTEETLIALKEAQERGAKVVAITSGGQLGALADTHGWPSVRFPGGQPPRSQFGYAFTSVFHVLHAAGLASDSQREAFGRVGDHLAEGQENAISRAESLAELLAGRKVMLYSDASQEGLIIRWKQQLNENSKILCSHHVFPEMNHNELVGWESGGEEIIAIVIQTPEDHPRTRSRMEVCMEIFREQGADVVVIEGDGNDSVLRFFDLVHVGDWASLLLAERAGVDPVDIRNIERLKDALSKIPY